MPALRESEAQTYSVEVGERSISTELFEIPDFKQRQKLKALERTRARRALCLRSACSGR
jgi:hypothetical protein